MRGTSIAVFILCFGAVASFMAVSGINDVAGVSPGAGVQTQSEQVHEDLVGEQRPSDRGGGGGLLGFAVFAADQLGNLFSLFGTVSALLQFGGLPESLANSIQQIVELIGIFMLIMILRGVIW